MSSPGWQALGVIHHDIAFRLTLDAVERAKVLDKIAGIDWSRFNKDWLTLGIGHPEVDKKTGQQVKDNAGRLKVALTGAGRTNTQKLIDYIRERAGIPAPAPDSEARKKRLEIAGSPRGQSPLAFTA